MKVQSLSMDPSAIFLKIFDEDLSGILVLRELDRMDSDF